VISQDFRSLKICKCNSLLLNLSQEPVASWIAPDVEMISVIMPPSALDHLTRLNIVYPMLFKLTNRKTDRVTHCGVLEFVADEGKVYLPYWMMRNLLLDEGDLLQVESASLPVATFSKFQPHSTDFLDITNPKVNFRQKII